MQLKIAPEESAARLKLELFCSGIQLSEQILGHHREIIRTRGGLGSGIDLILPDDIWVNVPVQEYFVRQSPFTLEKQDDEFWIHRNHRPAVQIRFAPSPHFYSLSTSTGIPMKQIGTLQGGYLAFFPTASCENWTTSEQCQFCSTGLNLGITERQVKTVEEVVEVAKRAFEEKLASYIHVNIGLTRTPDRGILKLAPYIKALKQETDALIVCQCTPPETNDWADYAYSIGVDSMSSNFEFFDENCFKTYCPGKARYIGQKRFFEWLEYLPSIFKSGSAAGEIIVGLEPLLKSREAIDFITSKGAHPIICPFRPLLGTPLEHHSPPSPPELEQLMIHAFHQCKVHNVRMNALRHVSIVMMAYEARKLISGYKDSSADRITDSILGTNVGFHTVKKLVLDRRRKRFLRHYHPIMRSESVGLSTIPRSSN